MGYYWQSFSGHVRVMNDARPVNDWLADAATSPKLKERLALSQRIRSYAVSELKLPDNASYHRYADLKRPAVVWNVVAAPEYSLKLKTWCFPVVGCVGYRGYFDEAAARAEAERVRLEEGLEVNVYPVPAYSTLGWMNWAGGDPLLSTFIGYPEGELARLIFHELAHQVAYASGDTMFNESFATAVERLGGARWLQTQASPQVRKEYEDFDGRRRQFRALALATRNQLTRVYEDEPPEQRPALKNKAMQEFRDQYAQLKTGWGGFVGYDRFVARANNAAFGTQAAYDDLVPGFEALYEREGADWQRFYDAVKRLAALPKEQRHQALKETPRA
ncbi:MAG: aminopeptidase [Bdellovibrionales bacterium]|nr:aminopeptidase [Ramlibacter sp.]